MGAGSGAQSSVKSHLSLPARDHNAGAPQPPSTLVAAGWGQGEGIVKGPHIVGTVASMGFKPRHVGKLLHDNIGNLWQRDGERFYTTLPPLN